MNFRLFIALIVVFGFSNCSEEEFDSKWTLLGYSNIVGQVHCTYDEGDIIWRFDDDKLIMSGRLITPRAHTICYEVDSEYAEEMVFEIEESNNEKVILIEELDLTAKITISEELLLELISSSDLKPSFEGAKIIFRKL